MEFRPFNRNLLGDNHETLRSALDFRCVALWQAFWPGASQEELLRRHTLAPLFTWRTTFTHQKGKRLVLDGSKAVELFIPLGLQKACYKYCPECWKEQLNRTGERHWSVLWQVPGVDICLRHQTPLWETNLPLNARGLPIEDGYVKPDIVKESRPLEVCRHSKMIAETAGNLLEMAPFHAISVTEWFGYLCWLLGQPNLTLNNQMRLLQSCEIMRKLSEYWGADFMKIDGWEYPMGDLKNEKWWGWLKLLKAIAPGKDLVEALYECIELHSKGILKPYVA